MWPPPDWRRADRTGSNTLESRSGAIGEIRLGVPTGAEARRTGTKIAERSREWPKTPQVGAAVWRARYLRRWFVSDRCSLLLIRMKYNNRIEFALNEKNWIYYRPPQSYSVIHQNLLSFVILLKGITMAKRHETPQLVVPSPSPTSSVVLITNQNIIWSLNIVVTSQK